MPELESSLHALAEAYGIATDYWDWQGRHIEVARETVVAVLAALDVDAATPDAAAAALAEQQRRPWTRMLPPLLALREHRTASVEMHVPHGDPAETWIELETGGHRGPLRQLENWNPPQEIDGGWVGEASFEIPGDLPLGYHTLHARSHERTATMPLIITPEWLGLPDRMGERRAWGLAAQLYSVRSRQSWGVGDLTDLEDLAVWSAGAHGADYVLVNPLHAAEPRPPMEPSPYLPTSRRFANPIYLRLGADPGVRPRSTTGSAARSTSTGSSSRSGWPGPPRSTGTCPGRPSARRWRSSSPCRAPQAGRRHSRRTGPARVGG